ncbi:hypothetical protein [Pseudomonas aeruginosa]|uniref:hypothetical protein n=1 Tax=Pseudomonas aeruginosa TaxID=287 RepID=UPI000E69F0D9|nr:hypothetical protein [Pseudomonas aeruginosa]RIY89773.1 hypothetical protein AXW94_30330 [Pseudomonas aeruginosa]
MKFKRYLIRHRTLDLNDRKRAAFERKQRKEAEGLPLFSSEVRELQHSWEEEKRLREITERKIIDRMRGRQAASWLRVRVAYFALPAEVRAQCRAAWNAWTGPNDPGYLIYIVNGFNGVRASREAQALEERRALRGRLVAHLQQQPSLF